MTEGPQEQQLGIRKAAGSGLGSHELSLQGNSPDPQKAWWQRDDELVGLVTAAWCCQVFLAWKALSAAGWVSGCFLLVK